MKPYFPIFVLFLSFLSGLAAPSFLLTPACAKEAPACCVCGKKCTGKYYIKDGKAFCSDACLGKLYRCASCGVALGTSANPRFTTLKDIHENDIYFCQECMKKTGCYFCGSRKGTTQLRDGRTICSTCSEHAIFKTEDAIPILKAARKMLYENFGFPNDREIPLKVVTTVEFQRHLSHSHATPNALALHLTEVNGSTQLSDDGKILTVQLEEIDSGMIVLEGSPAEMAFDSIAHELTHEFIRRRFYHIDDPKIEEGFCEAIAAACSILHGFPSLATRRISNDDPIYGDGFRIMYTMLQDRGWDETMKFLKKHSQSVEQYFQSHLNEVLDADMQEHLKKNNLHPRVRFVK